MKKTVLILGIAVAAMAVSCTREDSFMDNKVTTFDVDRAYVSVVISDAGSESTRASYTGDYGDYEDGLADERTVARAEFYFYDHFGEYVTSATVWNDGEPNTTSDNIEFNGNTVIVLDDIYGKQGPMYLVTVLNPKDGFKPAATLREFQTEYSNDETTDGGLYRNVDGTNYFTMSTTSYAGKGITVTDENSYSAYFVNEVTDEYFQKSPLEDAALGDHSVVIYVERLAAKVEVGINSANVAGETVDVTTTDDEGNENTEQKYMYPLNVTIAGDENSDDNQTDIEGTEDIYVDLIGWKLNATSKHSYMSKNIDETKWTDDYFGTFAWNNSAYYRSYWAMSPSYGWTDAPASSGKLTEAEEADSWSDYYLNYVSLADESTLFPFTATDTKSNYTYCAENTNTVSSSTIASTNSSLLTSVLIKARLYIKDSETGVCMPLENVVRYEGMLWTEERYINYFFSHIGAYEPIYETDADGEYVTDESTGEKIITGYQTLTQDYAKAELYETANSIMYIRITNEAGPYYQKDSSGEFISLKNTDLSTQIDNYNQAFSPVGYTGGLMYYTIPIKHLRADVGEDETLDNLLEANYGVVRNHYYKLTIDSLTGIGKGISDENEIIVPSDEDEYDTYAVGATINILTWKIVDQTVSL